ncbi:hypothetical protein N431DRAFT_438170 [Stipitochalara longipes BDJ]|nr:hypothetical protein N431DRAFT_438170 [Stipitochalara longipes BDJ]
MTTITLVPIPINTASDDSYPHFPTGKGIPSGIFYPGFATGSRAARPTGHPRYRNHTHHYHYPTGSSRTDSIPFFTLTYTGTLPLPTPISTASPEFTITLTNPGSLVLPSTISTDCPDMSSSTQSSSSTTPTTPEFESYSAASPSTALATYQPYRRKRAARASSLRKGSESVHFETN